MYMKRTTFRQVALLPLIGALLLLISTGISQAATYYVSNNGSAIWPQCTNINTPCNAQTAFNNASAGDIVYFRGGTYTVPQRNFGTSYTSYYMPAHSGTASAWITFQAYPGETPLFNGTTGGSGDVYGTNGPIGAKIMGVSQQSYIIIDGFSFQANGGTAMAGVTVGGNDALTPGPYPTHHVIIKNCMINGGTTIITGTDNADGIRINSASDVVIHGNTIYNFRQVSDWANTAATKAYHTTSVTYENNEIYNSTSGIYDKSGGIGNVYRYNYIHNVAFGIHIVTNSYRQINGAIYHNLVTYVTGSPIEVSSEVAGVPYLSTNWIIYNNTVYSNVAAISHPLFIGGQGFGAGLTGYSVYNNVFQQRGSDYGGAGLRTSIDDAAGLTTLDYNNYSENMSVRLVVGGAGTNYTSLSGLRAVAAYNRPAGSHDMHSIAAATVFTNGSGSLNQALDFSLAPTSPGHNAGSDGTDMGANIALVGTGKTVASQPVPTTGPTEPTINPPTPPTGLTIIF